MSSVAPGSREAAPDAGTVPAPAGTVLDRLIERVRAKGRTLDGQERPAAIVWTDPGREWQSLLESMQGRLGLFRLTIHRRFP